MHNRLEEKKIISVIVATYNRCQNLRNTLDSILFQDITGDFDFEIIVVDNNSNDKTKNVIEYYRPKFAGRLKYLFEPRQGKSFALNKGREEAKGEIIAFTDDDCIVNKDWLKNINEVFKIKNIDVLSGRVEPLFVSPKPRWLNVDKMRGPIVYHHLSDVYIENDKKKVRTCGSNLSIKRNSFYKFGGFTYFGRGQDSELGNRWAKLGAKIAYDPNPVVYHYTPASRLTKNYFRKWYFLCGKHNSMFDREEYTQGRCFLWIPLWIYKKLLMSILSFLKSLKLSKSEIFSNEIWFWFTLGEICGCLGFKKLLEDLR
ncbi:MAG: glycosyltransferase [Candidatus Omnitrophota bacterium]